MFAPNNIIHRALINKLRYLCAFYACGLLYNYKDLGFTLQAIRITSNHINIQQLHKMHSE